MLSVHDTNWHIFTNDTGEGSESCLTCGGTWEYTDTVEDPKGSPDSVDRTYSASNGDAPTRCSGRTDLVHGEAPCENDNGRECAEARESDDGLCEHTRHVCNCLFCA